MRNSFVPLVFIAVIGQAVALNAPESQAVSLIPQPAKLVSGMGRFTLTSATQVAADVTSKATARQFVDEISPATGFNIKVIGKPDDSRPSIVFRQDPSLTQLGSEGYRLTVQPKSIKLTSPTQAGLFYGVQTLRQLLPVQIFATAPVRDVIWAVPCVTIEDQPRFAWRGLMLDGGHDFQTKAFVLRFIDLMALHKFNVLHWHLTDTGTWSIEIKGYPKLTDPATQGQGVRAGHYTQDEIREVVRYADERHITILPEIDMPGHLNAALSAYPEMDCPVPREVEKNARQPRPLEVCLGNEKTYAFAEEVLSQVTALFPGSYIHIGGDECPKGRWERCPLCQARMKKENLPDGKALQSFFIKHMEAFLQSKGKKMIGWDEILEGGLAPHATVMSWRGMAGGVEAAKTGHDVIMAPKQFTYFDYPEMSVHKVYSFDPIPNELPAAEAGHILGAQGQMWTDRHPAENQIDAMVHPRSAALAEVLWSPREGRDYDGLMKRLKTHVQRLAMLGVQYRPLMAGTPVGDWEGKVLERPEVMEWPLRKGVSGAGDYQLKIENERGVPLTVDKVEIVRDGKVLATGKKADIPGPQVVRKIYQLTLPEISRSPLILRVTALTEAKGKNGSTGTIYLEKRAP